MASTPLASGGGPATFAAMVLLLGFLFFFLPLFVAVMGLFWLSVRNMRLPPSKVRRSHAVKALLFAIVPPALGVGSMLAPMPAQSIRESTARAVAIVLLLSGLCAEALAMRHGFLAQSDAGCFAMALSLLVMLVALPIVLALIVH